MKNSYTIAEKLKITEEYKSSDLSKVSFCKRNGITPTTLRTWIKERESSKVGPKFIEIGLKQECSTEIVISIDRFQVKVDKSTDFDILGNLLRLVKSI